MSEAVHTPGPWRVDGAFTAEIQSVDGLHVATVRPTPDQREASNAHLIAAAPELFAAVEELLWVRTGDGLLDPACGAFLRGQAALAKAKGGAK